MKRSTIALPLILVGLISIASISSFAQKKAKPPVCKAAVLAASKPLPKLKYKCDPDVADYEATILKQPNRIRAIKALERSLGTFTNPAWWQASVDDLALCELHHKPGALSAEEQETYRARDFVYDLFGNHSVRLVLLRDPCYYTGFFGSNAFLLYRKAGKVFVTEVLDGFSSRADNPIDLNFADLNGQQIIEISSTSGGLHASVNNYYFAIDPKTNKAVAKKIFKGEKGLTNEISSQLLMSEPEDVGLPKTATELNIIRDHKLAPSFSTYAEDEDGQLETPVGKMKRTILKWNGRFYQ